MFYICRDNFFKSIILFCKWDDLVLFSVPGQVYLFFPNIRWGQKRKLSYLDWLTFGKQFSFPLALSEIGCVFNSSVYCLYFRFRIYYFIDTSLNGFHYLRKLLIVYYKVGIIFIKALCEIIQSRIFYGYNQFFNGINGYNQFFSQVKMEFKKANKSPNSFNLESLIE